MNLRKEMLRLGPDEESDAESVREAAKTSPAASPSADVVRFASLTINAIADAPSPKVLMMVSVSATVALSRLVRQTAAALVQLQTRKVLAAFLSPPGDEMPKPDSTTLSALPSDWRLAESEGYFEVHWAPGAKHHAPGTPATAMSELLHCVRNDFDYILVDAGSWADSPLALTTAPFCSAAILAVKAGESIAEIRRTQALLNHARIRILGFTFVESA
jgi:hypothetical protein